MCWNFFFFFFGEKIEENVNDVYKSCAKLFDIFM